MSDAPTDDAPRRERLIDERCDARFDGGEPVAVSTVTTWEAHEGSQPDAEVVGRHTLRSTWRVADGRARLASVEPQGEARDGSLVAVAPLEAGALRALAQAEASVATVPGVEDVVPVEETVAALLDGARELVAGGEGHE